MRVELLARETLERPSLSPFVVTVSDFTIELPSNDPPDGGEISTPISGHSRSATVCCVHLTVRAHPGASRQRIEWDGSVAHVWVTPRAADGAANRAVVLAVAGWLDLPPSRVRLVHGTRGRVKVLEVQGLDAPPPS